MIGAAVASLVILAALQMITQSSQISAFSAPRGEASRRALRLTGRGDAPLDRLPERVQPALDAPERADHAADDDRAKQVEEARGVDRELDAHREHTLVDQVADRVIDHRGR